MASKLIKLLGEKVDISKYAKNVEIKQNGSRRDDYYLVTEQNIPHIYKHYCLAYSSEKLKTIKSRIHQIEATHNLSVFFCVDHLSRSFSGFYIIIKFFEGEYLYKLPANRYIHPVTPYYFPTTCGGLYIKEDYSDIIGF